MTESQVFETTVSILRPNIDEARREGFPEAQIAADVAKYLESLADNVIRHVPSSIPIKTRRRMAKQLNNRVMAELFPDRN